MAFGFACIDGEPGRAQAMDSSAADAVNNGPAK
jgi:hypothetical protein